MDIKQALGKQEEDRVFSIVSDIPKIKIWRNLYIPCAGGRTAEIDFLLLSASGITALEVKNCGSGRVIGSKTRYEWALHKGKDAKPKHFYSPLKQSDKHLAAISRYLGIPLGNCKGVVVFSDRTELKKVPRTPSCTVINTRCLSGYLRRLTSRKPCFSPTELCRLEQRLDALVVSDAIKRRHIIHARQAERSRKEEQQRRRASRKRHS